MEEKKKVSKAQIKAVSKYEKKNYFKALVRFPIDKEKEIRQFSGNSLNGYIVQAVLEKIERDKQAQSETKTETK